MIAGISTASLFQKVDNEESFSLFHKLGVNCTEMFFTSFCEYEPSFAASMKKDQGEIQVNSVHTLTTNFEPQLYSEHHKVAGDAYALLEKVMRSAQILGAKYYTFHGLARLKRMNTYDNYDLFGKKTKEIYDFCLNYGVQLAYENVEWCLYNRPGVFTKLKEYCPNLKGVLDIKQARNSTYDYREYLTEMGSSLSHVHISDITAEGKMCLPGRGIFDFDEFFKRLADVGFHGAALIEVYHRDYSTFDELKDSIDFVREKIEKYR